MNFKRRFRGYHRELVDKYIAHCNEVNNMALHQVDSLLELLKAEGQMLEKEYEKLGQMSAEAQERMESLASSREMIDGLFAIMNDTIKAKRSRIAEMASSMMAELQISYEGLKKDANRIENDINLVKKQIEDRIHSSQEVLYSHEIALKRINDRYIPTDALDSYPAVSDPQAPANTGNEKRNFQVVEGGASTREEAQGKLEPGKPWHVLVVDDDLTILAMLRAIFEREGALVTEARDGNEAKDLFEAMEPPDIVVLDIMLPYIDGYQLLGRMRSSDKWKDTPVIMLTSKTGEKEIVKLLQAGANDYMTKPFNARELMTRVKKITRRSVQTL